MSDPQHLRLVDADTGEVHDACPNCEALSAQLAGVEKEVRAWRTRYQKLKQDDEKEARDHNLFPTAKRLFDVWRHVCDHEQARFTIDRFWLIEPFLRSHGSIRCCRAILGAAKDPFVTRRKNGREKRHNGWDLVFRSADKLEDFEERAPPRFTDDYIKRKLSDGEAES